MTRDHEPTASNSDFNRDHKPAMNEADVVRATTSYAMLASAAQIEDMMRRAYGDRPPGSTARWLDENRPGWRDRACSVEGCEKKARARGWCGAHYERWRRWGDPTGTPPPKPPPPTHAEIVEECWATYDLFQEEMDE